MAARVPPDPDRRPEASLGDRIRTARDHRSVGREAELALFADVLAGATPGVNLVYIHGSGGVGKSTLLAAMLGLARERGRPVVELDGGEPGLRPDEIRDRVLAAPDGPGLVLGIDTYERLDGLDAWVRSTLLPGLPADTVVLIASRDAPAPAWRADPGWRSVLRELPLRDLTPDEAGRYLEAEGIDPATAARAATLTHGHPLALSLVSDALRRGGPSAAAALGDGLVATPDIVAALLARLVDDVPSPIDGRALAVLAQASTTDEATLVAALDVSPATAGASFSWLRSQSFVREGARGLVPHDLARDVLEADLRWRDPAGFDALHRRLFRHFVARARAARDRDRQRATGDAMFLSRHNPYVAANWDAAAFATAWADRLQPDDGPALIAMAERHEGPASADLVRFWLERQPENVIVFRDATPAPVGFVIHIALDRATGADLEHDPGARAMWAYALEHGAPRPGDDVSAWVFNIDRDAYQRVGTATWTLGSVAHSERLFGLDRPAWEFFVYADPVAWAGPMAFADIARLPEADYDLGGRRYAVYGRDWRVDPFDAWLERMADRMLGGPPPVTPTAAGLEVLDEAAFADAVRQALRDLLRADRLASNPLVRSRLVASARGADDAPGTVLRGAIERAAATLAGSARGERILAVLDRTYLRPAASQEAAAEELDLPFSTFRRYLATGIEHVIAVLWAEELGPAGLDRATIG